MPPETDLDPIFAAAARSDAPGLVVGVAYRGAMVYRHGFGLASVELGVANAPHTRMRIGSASKQFTCLAALLLAEEGKLDIDGRARVYLPELDAGGTQPTLRQLMTHTSGQRCYVDMGFLVHGLETWPRGHAMETQCRQSEANFSPGDNMIYSNGGYHLLSVVIERVSGVPFERFLKERIFDPLGMFDTDSVPGDLQIQRGMATMHIPLPGGGHRRGIFPSDDVLGEGAIVSTVDDMLRWLAHLRGPHRVVGTASSWDQLLTVAELNGISSPYALGVMRHLYRGVEVIHHAGSVVGGSSQILTVPARALDIAILSNTAAMDPTALAYRIVDALLDPADLGLAEETVSSEQYGQLSDQWYASTESGLVVRFAEVSGSLALSVQNGAPLLLRRDGDNLRLGFEKLAAGPYDIGLDQLGHGTEAPASIVLSECGRPGRFERLQTLQHPPTSDGLVGRFRSPDLAAEAMLSVHGQELRMSILVPSKETHFTLRRLSDRFFAWEARDSLVPLRGVLTTDPAGGAVIGFSLHTLRTRHLKFLSAPAPASI